jgi:amino acid transporter
MSLFFYVLILFVICIFLAVLFINKSGKDINFGNKNFYTVIFILSLISLVISLFLFWNLGVYSDEYGSSPGNRGMVLVDNRLGQVGIDLHPVYYFRFQGIYPAQLTFL